MYIPLVQSIFMISQCSLSVRKVAYLFSISCSGSVAAHTKLVFFTSCVILDGPANNLLLQITVQYLMR